MRLRWVGALGALIALAVVTAVGTGPAAGGGKGNGKRLSKEERSVVASAKQKGEKVTLLFAAKSGETAQLSAALKGIGAEVGFESEGISYVRATIAADKVQAATELASVEAVDVDMDIPLDDPRPDGTQPVAPQAPPTAATPRSNGYMPTRDTGAAQWVDASPTLDGRGTTVGIIDSGVDLDHSSLNTTSTGERKIVDWVTYTHPTLDNDPTWVSMTTTVNGPAFTATGGSYTAPGAGPYQFGRFDERLTALGGEVGSDVNRDGNPPGSNGVFPVLWDKATNKVWVDTNQNNSFADQTAMTDYKVNFDVGTFGTDNPATPIREAMPFVVQTASSAAGVANYVNIGIVSGAHGSHVAGIVAANKMFGGSMSGAAPGAKLVSVRVCLFNPAGCTAHALIEGMIYAVEKAGVDVINMSIGGLPALNDANNARAVLYDRLIEENGVQMFISAGNSGAGLNTIGDPSVASKVMSVGSSITNETWRLNYGSDSAFADNLHPFSSRGPTESGAFKPQITAPGSAVSTTPTWQPGSGLPYALPPGYSMFNGTSMASPQSAGAAALLLGAAKASGLEVTPAQLRQALNSTARYFDRYQASDQGNGLLVLNAAWAMLKAGVTPVTITSEVPVNTVLSGFLAKPGIGVGIYDREGVVAGQKYDRHITFTRTSGPSTSTVYKLSWVGNDGTFQSASALPLQLNQPNSLKVKVEPGTSGLHSAILNVDDPNTPGVDYQTMNTVVAADTFTAANSFTVKKSGTIGRNQTESFFFAVPGGTPAFKVDITGGGAAPGAGQIRFLRFHPYGVGIETNATTNCYNPAEAAGCNGGQSPTSRTVQDPLAGVWEVVVEARRTSDTASAPFTLTASILGATVTPNPDTIASATLGVPIARSYTLKNQFGPFTGRAVGTALGSAKLQTPTIAHEAQQSYTVAVTPGSTSLRATIGSPSDPAADLDLFLYRPNGTLAGQSADGDSEESVTVTMGGLNQPGVWTVIVDGYSIPAGTTTYKYVDVFANPAFGSVAVTDANATRAAGASWTVPGTVTANAAPAAGRVLLGNVQVRTDENVLIGSGDVIVQSVS